MNQLNDKQFVNNVYRVMLGRNPDPAGFAGLLYKLSIGVPRQDILREVSGSEEFHSRLASFNQVPQQSGSVDRRRGNQDVLHDILDVFDECEIGLPPPTLVPSSSLVEGSCVAAEMMQMLEGELGSIADSDYFKCSRERFTHLVQLALEVLPRGSHLLDVGNAPGYLAQALYLAGYAVAGINLSDAWNATYPDLEYLKRFDVKSCNIEISPLPYADQSFDGIVFTEVLEHIAVTRPEELLIEFKRVLKPGGVVLFSTPNVCNLSNILALATGKNVFWPTSMFYGSTDRHNREWTPTEVRQLFEAAGFRAEYFYGMNDHANWRMGVADQIYALLGNHPKSHALLRNTTVGLFRTDGLTSKK